MYGSFILCYELWKIIYVKDAKELYNNDISHNNMYVGHGSARQQSQ